MSIEEEKFALEKARFDSEQTKFSKSEEREERRFKADHSARRWSQIATFIPILAIILGFYANKVLESVKHNNATTATQIKLQREFIDRQLSDFYYPIKMRLEKDTAIWELSKQLSEKNKINTGDDFSKYVENSVLIPNHEEIISIVSKNFGLIKNANEQYDTKPLIESINHYQRHFSAYKTLRTLGMYNLNPAQVCKGCEWPVSFPKLINERIVQLEKQRKTLSGEQSADQ